VSIFSIISTEFSRLPHLRMEPMTSQPTINKAAVVSWLDGQNTEDDEFEAITMPKKTKAKGKQLWRADAAEKQPPRLLHRLPYPSFDPKSCLRVISMNLCSAVFGFNIVIGTVIRSSPRGISLLDIELNWIISLPAVSKAVPNWLSAHTADIANRPP
jgi:hypothetical protein